MAARLVFLELAALGQLALGLVSQLPALLLVIPLPEFQTLEILLLVLDSALAQELVLQARTQKLNSLRLDFHFDHLDSHSDYSDVNSDHSDRY